MYVDNQKLLIVSSINLYDNIVEEIIRDIPEDGSLKKIVLSSTSGSEKEYNNFFEELSKNSHKLKSVKSVAMNYSDVGSKNSLFPIVSFLKKLPALEDIDFSNSHIDDNNVKPLQDFVFSNKKIKNLDIRDSRLTDDGMMPFLRILRDPFHNLRELRSVNALMSNEMGVKIANAIVEKPKKILRLKQRANKNNSNLGLISKRNSKRGR